jgi:hydroxybutyrate-dimer hydrolase
MRSTLWGGVALTTLALSACGGGDAPALNADNAPVLNTQPTFVRGTLSNAYYDGTSDDLLTAGLGMTGLQGAAPTFADPAAPTAAELRRNAIYTNYRAVVDYTDGGGFGRLFGPNIDAAGNATTSEGKVSGHEFIAVSDDGTGRQNVTLMVQVPDSFDKNRPCIITGTSSGSRGVYGAIGTAGEWGLRRGCAVAYADKGTGNGLHDLTSNEVHSINGILSPRADAGLSALFSVELSDAERTAFNAAYPNRVAYKHAHSQQNPEKDWGKYTLQSVELAFYVLNTLHGDTVNGQRLRSIQPSNTLVIASSISNGGGAALAAAEQDTQGLIDGVAVSEPNAQPGSNSGLVIRQGSNTVGTHSKPLIDYFTYANLYQPCAALSARTTQGLNAFFWPASYQTAAQNRCQGLRDKGLLSANTLADQADEALDNLHAYGWASEQDYLHQSHFRFATNAIVMTYVNAHGRFSVADNVCGFSFANTAADGSVAAQVRNTQAALFATGNGVPPTGGINVVYNLSKDGPVLDFLATSPSTNRQDMALDGALCMRSLVTGRDPVSGNVLFGEARRQAERVAQGISEVQLSARLRGKPTLIVSGRSDALVPVNHASRAYVGKALLQDAAAPVRYIEVTNAQHFDTFIAFGALLGYETRYVPLHPYFVRAMDAMWDHLNSGAALPASQVVRGVARGAGEKLEAINVPAWSATPGAQAISFSGSTLSIPD